MNTDNQDHIGKKKTPAKTKGQIQTSTFHEEMTASKIDKLSMRVTIISIIIPCLIGAVLFFAYIDLKERIAGADLNKGNQIKTLSQQLEKEIETADMKITQSKLELETKLKELKKKSTALEGKITQLTSAKDTNKSIFSQLSKLEKRTTNNANQNKASLQTIERINKSTLAAIKENKKQISLAKKEFIDLSMAYGDLISELRKDISLLNKKHKELERTNLSQERFDKTIDQLKIDLNNQMTKFDKKIEMIDKRSFANFSRLQKDIDLLIESSLSTSTDDRQKPQTNAGNDTITQ